jgi:hypothetical protein
MEFHVAVPNYDVCSYKRGMLERPVNVQSSVWLCLIMMFVHIKGECRSALRTFRVPCGYE